MADRINALVFAGLLGMPPTDTDLETLEVPADRDPTEYRDSIRSHLTAVADARAAGDDANANRLADELVNGHGIAVRLAGETDPRATFATLFTDRLQAQENP